MAEKLYLKLNSGRVLPVERIKQIEPATEDDRRRMAEKYNIDASEFNTTIRFTDGTQKSVRDRISEIHDRIGLVNLHGKTADKQVFIPADNILATEPFTAADMDKLRETIREQGQDPERISSEFQTRVVLPGANMSVLTRRPAEEIMTQRQAAKARTMKA